MSKISIWILCVLFSIIVIFLAWVYFIGDVDSCLDSGGCWDYSAKVCRKEESNAQQLCDQSNPF
jgi:hypothetical protein